MLPIKINAVGQLTVARCNCTLSMITPPIPPSVELPKASCARQARRRKLWSDPKRSALVGGAQVANIAIGVVRTKAMAMPLGPAGFGLFGLYGIDPEPDPKRRRNGHQ